MQSFTNTTSIIVVDDMPLFSELVETLLESAGISNVRTFSCPFRALEYVRNNNTISIIISDFQMPIMNGMELIEQACKFDKNIIGILISSATSLIPKNHNYYVFDKGNELIHFLIPTVIACLSHNNRVIV